MPAKSLEGQVALVTGAGRRIGRAIALRLAADGARVIVHYRNSQAEAAAVVSEIMGSGGDAYALRADLTRVGEIEQLFSEIERQCGGLDILINNAGVFAPTPVGKTTEAQWDLLLDSNVKAQFFCAQSAGPMLKRKGRGRIVNFASLGGLLAWSQYTAYSVSKAGVIMLTRCLSRAMAPEVTVNAIAPGTISFPDDAPEIAETFIRRAPLGRTGKAEDIVGAVIYAIDSPFVTGQVLVVDGGRSIPS
jgi:NAD(P)-dependent dehydrogenase (short-subunit alcohol dehydrogenase family)